MSAWHSGVAGSSPPLVVRTRQAEYRLISGTAYHVGRDPAADIAVPDARVSWRHAVLRHEPGGWVLEDARSTNGTFAGGQRISRFAITTDCVIRLGDRDDGPVLRCEPALPAWPRAHRDRQPVPWRGHGRRGRRPAAARPIPADSLSPEENHPVRPASPRARAGRLPAKRGPAADGGAARACPPAADRPDVRQRPRPFRPHRLPPPRRAAQVGERALRDRPIWAATTARSSTGSGSPPPRSPKRTSSASDTRRSGWPANSCANTSTPVTSRSSRRTWSSRSAAARCCWIT